jgi:hypothetical protein
MSNINLGNIATFGFLTAVFLMFWVFWDVTMCRAIDSRRYVKMKALRSLETSEMRQSRITKDLTNNNNNNNIYLTAIGLSPGGSGFF